MNKPLLALAAILALGAALLLALPIRLPPLEEYAAKGSRYQDSTERQTESPRGATPIAVPLSPGRLSALFPTARDAPDSTGAPIQSAPAKPAATWLKSLGTVRDSSGVERQYFKDTRNGSILKFRVDGIEEKGYRLVRPESGPSSIMTPDGAYTLQEDPRR